MSSNKKQSGCASCLFKVFLAVFVISMAMNFFSDGFDSTSKPIDTTYSAGSQHINQTEDGYSKLPEKGWIEAQLNEDERRIYNGMVSALAMGKTECRVDGISKENLKEEMGRAVRAVIFEHPEFFWYGGSYSYSTRGFFGSSSLTVKMIPYDYWTYTSDPQGYIDRLNSKVREIADQARTYASRFEQVKFVHDYIVKNTDYNHEAAAETTSSVRKASSEQSYSAYGCLVNGSAVCGGYSKAFQMLMTALDIECIYIKGETEGGLHAWDCVKLEDEYYLFDATWDDPGLKYEDGTLRYPHGVRYTYFGLTNEQMDQSHTPLNYFSFPVCTATDYHYFRHEGLYLETDDLSRIDRALKKQTDTDIVAVAFSKDAYPAAKAKIIDKKGYRELDALKGEKFAYSADDDNCLLVFYRNYK